MGNSSGTPGIPFAAAQYAGRIIWDWVDQDETTDEVTQILVVHGGDTAKKLHQ
jgi:hypothetical protein